MFVAILFPILSTNLESCTWHISNIEEIKNHVFKATLYMADTRWKPSLGQGKVIISNL